MQSTVKHSHCASEDEKYVTQNPLRFFSILSPMHESSECQCLDTPGWQLNGKPTDSEVVA